MPGCGSGAVVCSCSLLFGCHLGRRQAETPLTPLSKFSRPALNSQPSFVRMARPSDFFRMADTFQSFTADKPDSFAISIICLTDFGEHASQARIRSSLSSLERPVPCSRSLRADRSSKLFLEFHSRLLRKRILAV